MKLLFLFGNQEIYSHFTIRITDREDLYLPHLVYRPPLLGTGHPAVALTESQTSTQSATVTCKINVQIL